MALDEEGSTHFQVNLYQIWSARSKMLRFKVFQLLLLEAYLDMKQKTYDVR